MLTERIRKLSRQGRLTTGFLIVLCFVCGLSGCNSESELQKQYDKGYEQGSRDGFEKGYGEGYEEGVNGKPRRFNRQDQNEYLNTIVYVCSALTIVVFLYWTLYIYGFFINSAGLLQQATSDSFYRGVWPKLLVTLATVALVLLLLPADYLVRLNLYLRAKLNHQYLVVTVGILLSFATVFAISKTTTVRKSGLKLVSQLIWAMLFPIIIFEMIGSFKVQGWEFEFANETLLLQAGMLIGPLILLSLQRLAKQIYEHID